MWVLSREVIGTGLQFQSLALFCGTWTVEARVETETWEGVVETVQGEMMVVQSSSRGVEKGPDSDYRLD